MTLQPALVVNGETVPAAAIAAEAQNHPAPPGKPGLAWRAAARALAIRALLLQEASRLGLAPAPRSLGVGRRETDDEALIRAVIEARVAPDPPSEAACRATYARHPERFRAPTLYAAAHILLPVAPEDAAARAAASATAAVLLAELGRDPGAFERLARAHSACSSREAGGRLGQILAGDTVPEFEAALDQLGLGEIAPEAVATRYGLHVIRLDARAEGALLPYEQVSPAHPREPREGRLGGGGEAARGDTDLQGGSYWRRSRPGRLTYLANRVEPSQQGRCGNWPASTRMSGSRRSMEISVRRHEFGAVDFGGRFAAKEGFPWGHTVAVDGPRGFGRSTVKERFSARKANRQPTLVLSVQ